MGSNFIRGEGSDHIISFDEYQEEYSNNVDHSLSRRTSRPENQAEIEGHHQEGVDEGLLAMMRNKISLAPLLIRESVLGENPCIFKLPLRFKNINGKSYKPEMVSIELYDRGKPHLQMMNVETVFGMRTRPAIGTAK